MNKEMKLAETQTSSPLRWTCLEYDYHPKTSNWFWFVASGALLIVIIAILMRNFLFAVFAIITAFVMAVLGTKKPQKINFAVSARGIEIGKQIYPYKELESFWINYDPPRKKELIIKSKKKLVGLIKIPLDSTDPNLVRKKLTRVLREEEVEESLIETIADWLRF